MKVKYYGLIQEEVGMSEENLDVTSTDELLELVSNRHPALNSVKKTLFLNQQLVNQNTEIKPEDEVVLCPPFAGG